MGLLISFKVLVKAHVELEPGALDVNTKVKSVRSADGFLGRLNEQCFPYGIYTIPEVSMVGKTEQQLTAEKVPFEVGLARYGQLAKGQMLGGADGLLKLLFCPRTLRLLGVHAIGEGATEIIHIGQVALESGGSLAYFRDTVFNYPTLAEAYSVAAYDGFQRIQMQRLLYDNKDDPLTDKDGARAEEASSQ